MTTQLHQSEKRVCANPPCTHSRAALASSPDEGGERR